MPLIVEFGKQEQEDLCDFKASLVYMSYPSRDYPIRSYLKQASKQANILIKHICHLSGLEAYKLLPGL